ncbi:sensor histidine kinase [Pararcticibacter amylolyticus]|uniref:Sensor histidine kinase n=2 Tax=Pararcticibacter amylolyticus TaxID=2173175 RepID=A0A2U2PAZ7_9SPHI|nr:sensor histidine kinase [Pararcticibacter amylolyticus]
MKQTERNRLFTFLVHIMLWLLFGLLLLFYLPWTWGGHLPPEFWIKQTIIFVLLVGVYYLNSLVIVPHVLQRNRFLNFVLAAILVSVFVTYLAQSTEKVLHLQELMDKAGQQRRIENRPERPVIDMFMLLMSFLVMGISTSIAAVQNWQRDARERQLLEQQKVSSELSLLKAQINPHFFFNTLNNIYALTHIDIESSRNALHKLSRMMRYVLYETQAPMTFLSKEVSFVVDYIELMKLRLTDKVKVKFDPPEIVHDLEIAPMLLLPFVENAFKHGISSFEPGYISISIRADDKSLELDMRNSIYSQNRTILEEGSGIGMSNTRRRLDLLYPERYKLEIAENRDAGEFRVSLKIFLL